LRSALELVELVAPNIPPGPPFARKQIQIRPPGESHDALVELIGLPGMLSDRRMNDIENVTVETSRVSAARE
jgi:hypothetical protein